MNCRVSWLNLHKWIPQRDVRKKIYALLSPLDREMIQFAHNSKRDGSVNMLANVCEAAENGYCEVVEWLLAKDKSSRYFSKKVCAAAANGGQLEILKFLTSLGFQWDAETSRNAAAQGHVHILEWLVANGLRRDHTSLQLATKFGHLNAVRFLLTNKLASLTEYELINAAIVGNMEMVEILLSFGAKWTARTTASVASSGNLDAVKWARQKNFPWDDNSTMLAVVYKKLAVLKWLLANGCPCHINCLSEARRMWPNENF